MTITSEPHGKLSFPMDHLKLNLPDGVRHYRPRNYQQTRFLGNIADATQPIPLAHNTPKDIEQAE